MKQMAASQQKRGFWAWWFRVTTPPEISGTAVPSLKEIEIYRRARLVSILTFVMYLMILASVPAAIVGTQVYLYIILSTECVLNVIALYYNRRGSVNIAGLILSMTYKAAIWIFITTAGPRGVTVGTLPIFVLMIMPEILVAALLPPWCVFIEAASNIAFIFAIITFYHSPEVHGQLIIDAYSYGGTGTVISQTLVAGVTFLWTRGTQQALARANRAEELSRLQHDLSEQDRIMAYQKKQLDIAIQKIEEMLEQVANGNLQARIPLTHENVLWSIAGKLNNLMGRFQRIVAAERQLQWVCSEVARVTEAVRAAKARNNPVQVSRGSTPMDILILELSENFVSNRAVSRNLSGDSLPSQNGERQNGYAALHRANLLQHFSEEDGPVKPNVNIGSISDMPSRPAFNMNHRRKSR